MLLNTLGQIPLHQASNLKVKLCVLTIQQNVSFFDTKYAVFTSNYFYVKTQLWSATLLYTVLEKIHRGDA